MDDKEERERTPTKRGSDSPGDDLGWIKDLAARYRELYPDEDINMKSRQKKK